MPLVVSVLESEDFDSLILDAMQVKHLDDVLAENFFPSALLFEAAHTRVPANVFQ